MLSIHLLFNRSSIVKILDGHEVTLEQVQTVDEVVLELCTKTPNDFFYLVTSDF